MSSSSNSEEWVDVFPLLKATATACLSNAKPLLATDDLSMFDLMNAAELMDPKMDQCFNISKPYMDDANTLKMCVYDITNPYQYAKNPMLGRLLTSIKVFNWLVVNEASCFEGSALLETLYYCKYTWLETWNRFSVRTAGTDIGPNSPYFPDYLLMEYCKVLMMSMEHYTQAVVDADIFEDDDFQVQQPLHDIKENHLPESYEPACGNGDDSANSSTALLASMLANGMNVGDINEEVIKGAIKDSQSGTQTGNAAGPAVNSGDDHLNILSNMDSLLGRSLEGHGGDVGTCLQYISLLFKYRRASTVLMTHTRRTMTALAKFSSRANDSRSKAGRGDNVLSHSAELKQLGMYSGELRTVVLELKEFYTVQVLPLLGDQGLMGHIDEPLPDTEVLPVPLPTVMCHPPVRINNFTVDADVQYAFHIGLVRLSVNFPIRAVKNTTNTTACLNTSLGFIADRIAGSGKPTDFQGLASASSVLAVFEENAAHLSLDELIQFLHERASSNSLHLLVRSYIYVYLRALLAATTAHATTNPAITAAAPAGGACRHSVATSCIVNSMSNAGIPREYILYQKEGTHEWLGITHGDSDTAAMGTPAMATYSNSLLVNHVNKLIQYMCMSRAKLPLRLEASVFPFWGNAGAATARGVDYYCTEEDVDDQGQVGKGVLPKWDFFFHWMGIQLGTFFDMFMGLQVENELVQSAELDYFYWYWDYINNFKSYLMDQMKTFRVAYEELFIRKGFNYKTKRLADLKKKGTSPAPTYYPNNAELVLKARGQVLRGYMRTMLLCTTLKVHRCTKFQSPFTSWEFRYWTRFKAFAQCATASYLPYSEYMKAVAQFGDVDAQTILSTAVTCFGNVKQYQDARRVLAEKQAASPFFPVYCTPLGTPALQALRKQMVDAQWKLLLKLSIMNSLNLTTFGKKHTAVVAPASMTTPAFDISMDFTQDPALPVHTLSVVEAEN